MKPILFVLFTVFLMLCACSSVKKSSQAVIEQGITGTITESKGNQMPGPGMPRPVPKGIKTTVLVYEPTNTNQVTRIGASPLYTAIRTKWVASVETNDDGTFSLSLAPGKYSVFIRQGNNYFANLFDMQNNIAVFEVVGGKMTVVNLVVNSEASY